MNESQIGKASHIASLIIRHMQNKLPDEEWAELENWLQEDGENYLLYEELMDEEKLGAAMDMLYTIDPEEAYERLSQKLALHREAPKRNAQKIWWYMAAVLLVLATGVIWLMNSDARPSTMPPPLVTAQQKRAGTKPDNEKAVLILADNTSILLDAILNGTVARQGNSLVTKKKQGELQYAFTGRDKFDIAYNTIQTPRGGEYSIVLDDGTKIWLNAASSLRFPVHFTGNERRVQLTGEAYFEVASHVSAETGRKNPFVVQVDDMNIHAIGTAFNITAYKEDEQTRATVIEGLVKVNSRQKEQLLQPGKKMVVQNSSVTVEDADIQQETAWKNGRFLFRNTSLQAVMNELARWYDVTIVYEKPVPSLHFNGEIRRQATICHVLEMLETAGGIQFSLKGHIVRVLPAKVF